MENRHPKVFLIAGKAGCGKNEVANIIKEELPNTVITAFSKYIKLFAYFLSERRILYNLYNYNISSIIFWQENFAWKPWQNCYIVVKK